VISSDRAKRSLGLVICTVMPHALICGFLSSVEIQAEDRRNDQVRAVVMLGPVGIQERPLLVLTVV
jgi:hypothetical protein